MLVNAGTGRVRVTIVLGFVISVVMVGIWQIGIRPFVSPTRDGVCYR